MPSKCKLLSPVLLSLLVLSAAMSCIQRRKPEAPIAKTVSTENSLHGVSWVDDYCWLRERDNLEVIEYLEAENRYSEAVMQRTAQLQEKLYQELRGRIKETDVTVPEKRGDYYYYARTEEGKQYEIHCRKRGSPDAAEETLLDENELAIGHRFMEVGVFEISPDQNLLAYSVDTNGSEIYTVYFKDLRTGGLLDDRVPNTSISVEWANDNKTIFYNVLDDAMRPYQLYRHRLGTDYRDDDLIYHELDGAYELYLAKTRSKQYLLLSLESNTTTEVRYLDADSPNEEFKVIHPRQHEMEYAVYHHHNKFYVQTNDDARNFKLMEVSVGNPAKKYWKEVIPHRDSVKIDGVDVFRNHLVVYERADGLKRINVIDLETKQSRHVEFPEQVYTFRRNENPDFDSELLRFTYTSLVTPKTVYDYNMNERTLELKKRYEVPGGYDPSQYRTERIFARASDGTAIPISIVYRKGMVRDGKNPFYLYGYGSYGSSSEPGFRSKYLSLLDRGFVVGIAHVRGGGEMGRQWYDQGKLLHKRNTFTDFVACAEHLIAEKYTSADRLVARGISAGGLLMGAVANMRPDLFQIIIAEVPFVDIVNTMLDASIPLTIIEWEEWGDPREKVYFDYMMSYSPYDNVAAQDYPHMLVTAGLNDARVQYWEPVKWTARLRATKTDDNRLLLKTKMGAGHFGPSGRYDYLREIAFQYAFIFDVLGIE